MQKLYGERHFFFIDGVMACSITQLGKIAFGAAEPVDDAQAARPSALRRPRLLGASSL